ncbi:MAG: hypothetical protein K2P59_06870 [Acetatifactor sp.]|nr:hypothetical protein [Acetatifactor sp.]
METYPEFLVRIDSFEQKEIHYGNSYFKGNPSIAQKVDRDNSFRDFYGDTIVFVLDDAVKKALAIPPLCGMWQRKCLIMS